jgi:hypothetical protein
MHVRDSGIEPDILGLLHVFRLVRDSLLSSPAVLAWRLGSLSKDPLVPIRRHVGARYLPPKRKRHELEVLPRDDRAAYSVVGLLLVAAVLA